MLTFVDESGDAGPGPAISRGSSLLFSVTAVHFHDKDEAQRCDQAISALRTVLRLSPRREFHFNQESHASRESFLRCVGQFDFIYTTAVLNKSLLSHATLHSKNAIYQEAVRCAFLSIQDQLDNAKVIFDQCGGREFSHTLHNYLTHQARSWSTDGRIRIRKVRSESSATNNLLQLADMISGAVFRSFSDDRSSPDRFRNLIRRREHRVDVWPKLPPEVSSDGA